MYHIQIFLRTFGEGKIKSHRQVHHTNSTVRLQWAERHMSCQSNIKPDSFENLGSEVHRGKQRQTLHHCKLCQALGCSQHNLRFRFLHVFMFVYYDYYYYYYYLFYIEERHCPNNTLRFLTTPHAWVGGCKQICYLDLDYIFWINSEYSSFIYLPQIIPESNSHFGYLQLPKI
jgi:hypothetical protein